ncbi:peptide ABC transporter substrate-binding protein [Bordetella trematum]|uniref:ABC transporter substrate-binding protein n=1 Tax=Bordetella trematum TaxID=123899 RepID=UPI000C761CF6|nr:ABC transporter substrate-binding protein [Bordetella trematum]AUL46562.1 peptide ABC transporter substrate-binding protein [Bordetella trematum]
MDRRSFLLATGASAAAFGLPSLAWAAPAKKVFRWVPQADLTLLDPMFTTVAMTQVHAQLVFDTLFGLDEQYQPTPQMAESAKSENDGLLWTITLRDGLKFHDGSPVRAQDAVASIQRWAKKDLMGRSLMQSTESLTALDDKTLQFKLKKPFPLILNALGRQSGNMAAIMPERLAQLPETEAVKEMVGSGPFTFDKDKWVSGSRVVYNKFDGYAPRKEDVKPSFTSGPKIAHVDEVNWHIIPDRATAIAALQANEVDGVEMVDPDFLPILSQDPNIHLVKRSLPTIGVMRLNHLHAPFNNPDIRRAVLSAVNQTEYMTAMNGADFPEYWSDRCGVFVPGSPMDSDAGMEKLTGKRDIEAARKAIKDAGYKGEKVVLLDPVDFPTWHAAALVTADLFKRLGFNVDVQTMDWGTAVQRRNNQEAPENGGWSVAFTGNTGPNNLDPAGHLAMRGNGKQAWFGWPTSERLEQLRLDWFNAPDLETQKKIGREIQLQVFEDVPYIPLGATYPVTALRKPWKDFQPQMSLFYTVNKD